MAVDVLHLLQPRARQTHQLMAHAQKMFTHDEQPGIGQQMMDIGHPACHGILDGDHPQIGITRFHQTQGVFKSCTANRIAAGIDFKRRNMRIGARLALIGDT